MVAWPISLEQCPVLGWNETPLDNVIEYQTDVGPPKRRRRSSGGGSKLSLQFKFSVEDYSTFMTFYRNTVLDGALAFDYKHPLTRATISVCFEEPPSITQQTPKTFLMACNFRILP